MTPAVEKLYQYIEETNEAFNKGTREEKRVQIAKDVLKQLELGRITPESVYMEYQISVQPLPEMQVRDFFKNMGNCAACAIGAMFIATVDRMDKLKIEDLSKNRGGRVVWNRCDMVQYLTKGVALFTDDELEFLEEMYEHPYAELGQNHLKRLENLARFIVDIQGVEITTDCIKKHLYIWLYDYTTESR